MTVDVLKRCSGCREVLPAAQFYRNKSTKDGLQYYCKSCWRARAAASKETTRDWRARNVERIRESHREWRQTNIQRARETSRESYRRHPERQRAASAAVYHADPKAANVARATRDKAKPALKVVRGHRYIAKKNGCEGDFTAQEWIDLCARQNFQCASCGEVKPLTVDHIIPRAKKGPNVIDNIQGLCLSCNARKGDRLETVQ